MLVSIMLAEYSPSFSYGFQSILQTSWVFLDKTFHMDDYFDCESPSLHPISTVRYEKGDVMEWFFVIMFGMVFFVSVKSDRQLRKIDLLRKEVGEVKESLKEIESKLETE